MPYTAQVLHAAPAEVQTGLRRAACTFPHFTLLETGRAHGAFREPLDRFDWLAAGGCLRRHRVAEATPEAWSELATAWRAKPTWLFGVLAYDAKNAFEPTAESRHRPTLDQPDWDFYEPAWVVTCQTGQLTLYLASPATLRPEDWWADIQERAASLRSEFFTEAATWRAGWTGETYQAQAESLQALMHAGDLYEVNLCAPWYAQGAANPAAVYAALQATADAPMAGLHRSPETWLISASPERYVTVRQEGEIWKAYSQPIKGTADRALPAEALLASEKERAENTMIVDLVRHDLSRVAARGSVHVPRYLQVRSLPTVHHLVSTVEATLRPETDWISVVQSSFPMGSMTGAPKIRAMQRIEEHECARRGWYSGALGYVMPSGECDFNVVIRSLLADSSAQNWMGWAGSALTVLADPASEWEELHLKMKAPQEALTSSNQQPHG